MIHKMPSTLRGYICVIFELPACIWADHIYLVGEFNGWNKYSIPLVPGRDGTWRVTLELPIGHSFQFRYLIDGSWQTDYHADGWVANDSGDHNSVVDAVLVSAVPSDQ